MKEGGGGGGEGRLKREGQSLLCDGQSKLPLEGGRVRAIYSINMVGRKERIKLKIIEGREIM